ncbi:MAG TPA: OmcA/MtrC family decaheme c-type cytochrome [Candidatus Binatia bacterium]
MTGPTGPSGPAPTTGTPLATTNSISIAVDDVAKTATLTVNFTVTDANGSYIPQLADASATNATQLAYMRFALAELQPAAANSGDADIWVNYTTGDRTPANLTDNHDGTYTYKFKTDLYAKYNAAWTHRLLLLVSATTVVPQLTEPKNVIYDFVPAQLPGPFTFATTRNIVTTDACNGCHGKLGSPLGAASFHGGSRYLVEACTVCHTTTLGTNGVAELAPFIHKIHAAKNDPNLVDLLSGVTKITYPGQKGTDSSTITALGGPSKALGAPIDCAKCHDSAAADSDHWNTRPTMTACGSCHEVDFAAGTNHAFGAQANNVLCAGCHPASSATGWPVKKYHMPTDATAANPDIPAGLAKIDYFIDSVTVNGSNQAVVTFHINKDGTPLDLSTYPPAGFSGGPSFLVGYTLPQGPITTPVDYNNLNRSAAQPFSVTLASLAASLTGTAASYTAILTTAPFPAGATMRAVSLQGYFTQVKGGSILADTPRHTLSVVAGVSVLKCSNNSSISCTVNADCGTGNTCVNTEAQRRVVVDKDKCLACHEILSLHGGNRVNEVQVCVICHNPNLSSSGRGADPANVDAANKQLLTDNGYDPTKPLTWPEATLNFKELVHGIHSAGVRTFPYEFVRDRGTSGVFYYNWSEVTFPGIPSNCLTCHKPGTFDADLPSGVLLTTDRTTSVADGNDPTTAAVVAARTSVPNVTDWVNSPTASACYFCHDGNLDAAHFGQNGGFLDLTRSDAVASNAPVETCKLCHGPGRLADVATIHPGLVATQ